MVILISERRQRARRITDRLVAIVTKINLYTDWGKTLGLPSGMRPTLCLTCFFLKFES